MAKTIKELFNEHGIDKPELVAGVENAIQIAESKNTENGIPYSRFKEKVGQYNDLLADKATLETDYDNLQKKVMKMEAEVQNLGEYKNKYESYENKIYERDLAVWNEKKQVFDAKEGDKLFEKIEKIKSKFNFGDDLNKQQLEKNLEKINIYEEAGYFTSADSKTNYNNIKTDPSKKEAGDGDYYGYETPQQLAWKAPELYEKWKKEQG